jgi:hypothetical protein
MKSFFNVGQKIFRVRNRLNFIHTTSSMSRTPDRWKDYKAIGDVIADTNLVAFKVPLHDVSYLSIKLRYILHNNGSMVHTLTRLLPVTISNFH